MKAVHITAYGDNSVLKVTKAAPKPQIKKDQILIENYASGINPFDVYVRAGHMQKTTSFSLPFIPGGDFSGRVVAMGEDVTGFEISDEVYGSANTFNGGSGSMAEYVAANSKNTALKPKSYDFIHSAASALVGTSTVQALEEHISLKKGQKILIHGGAGGIGSTAIQLAKSIGAYVTTTVSSHDMDFVRKLGADEVINYKTQKFEEILKNFDAVYVTVGGDITDRSFRVLRRGGVLVSMTGLPDQGMAKEYEVTAIGQNTGVLAHRLTRLAELIDNGKISIQIEKVYSMNDVKEAYHHQEAIHPRGNLVVKIRNKTSLFQRSKY